MKKSKSVVFSRKPCISSFPLYIYMTYSNAISFGSKLRILFIIMMRGQVRFLSWKIRRFCFLFWVSTLHCPSTWWCSGPATWYNIKCEGCGKTYYIFTIITSHTISAHKQLQCKRNILYLTRLRSKVFSLERTLVLTKFHIKTLWV